MMKLEDIIERIKLFKNDAAKRQMYELASNLRDVERELLMISIRDGSIEIREILVLLQNCLKDLPSDQKQLLIPVIREYKLRLLEI